ncbi:unnamed protein product [Heligmosomoides polygyrus]|uniref:RRM domain-containing protein n=1 Tax=Heligmosomoides polygyrus TaxID=6339 RepID=A0A3P7ZEP4_HELPZ|nr:unnamed protein product [Heligmosomoides polygyrus]
MIRDRETDKFKGFAYAEFTCAEDLKRVLEWNGVDYGGRPLKIDLAAQRTGGDRGGRGGRGSSRGSWSSAEPRGASERGGNWGSSEPRGGNWGSSEPRGNHGHGGSWTSVESRGGHDHQGSGSHGGYGGRPRSRPSEHEEVEIVEHPERPRLVLKPRTTDPAELEAKKKREAEEEAARRAKLFQEVVDESDGCGAKFLIVVVSDEFNGKRVLECHRLVQESIADVMPQIHAVTIQAYTQSKWETAKKAEA